MLLTTLNQVIITHINYTGTDSDVSQINLFNYYFEEK